jgi:hypothetical protein
LAEATWKGRAKGAMQIADDQRRNRADLLRERQREACYNKNAKDYPRYGGKGITVCNRWRFGENGKSDTIEGHIG